MKIDRSTQLLIDRCARTLLQVIRNSCGISTKLQFFFYPAYCHLFFLSAHENSAPLDAMVMLAIQ